MRQKPSGAFTKDIISNWPGPIPAECNEVAVPAATEAEKFHEMGGVQTEPHLIPMVDPIWVASIKAIG